MLAALADMRVVVSVNALAILALGIYPGALLRLCAGVIGPCGRQRRKKGSYAGTTRL